MDNKLLDELLEELEKYRELDYEDWDSYNAAPVDPECIDKTREFLLELTSEDSFLPYCDLDSLHVSPSPNGGVSVNWRSKEVANAYSMLRFEPNCGRLTCVSAICLGKGDRPKPVISSLSRIEAIDFLRSCMTIGVLSRMME